MCRCRGQSRRRLAALHPVFSSPVQAQRDAAEELRQAKIRSPARVLAEAVLSRGWRVGRPQFTIGDRRPSLDEDGLVHWPVLFFYPEVRAVAGAAATAGAPAVTGCCWRCSCRHRCCCCCHCRWRRRRRRHANVSTFSLHTGGYAAGHGG